MRRGHGALGGLRLALLGAWPFPRAQALAAANARDASSLEDDAPCE